MSVQKKSKLSYAEIARSKANANANANVNTKSTPIQKQIPVKIKPKERLFVVLCQDYPKAEYDTVIGVPLIKYLEQLDMCGKLDNWQDFAIGVSQFFEMLEISEGSEISVHKNSIWAICQDYLDKLSPDDRIYTSQLTGTWSFGDGSKGSRYVTIREIIDTFKNLFPVSCVE